uniref:Neuroblastoma-amplified sequence-like n=1 Tax=Dermatophagoides pteronyssinus TaxID=6956 RepID=A0A6P6XZR6_DERPT|nr:neuroblastoma-amplified sequence-like [Dermatophagoides pteronyssinus]
MDPSSSSIMDRSTNIVSRFISQIYFVTLFYLNYFLQLLRWPFRRYDQDSVDHPSIRPSKAIIDSLMGNFENGRLINANESVEQTFQRLIESRQYETAMKLAKKFDLQMDLLWKNMWLQQQNEEKSIQLIDECLSKINDQKWIFNQCIECIPEQLPVLRHLLQFGIERIQMINTSTQSTTNDDNDDNLFMAKIEKTLKSYLNRLDLYEKILKSKFNNENDYCDQFDWKFFEKFRQKNSFQLAIEHAHQSDIETLSVLFAQEYQTLARNFFVIISNLPETLSPSQYKDLIRLAISTLTDKFFTVSNDKNEEQDDYEKNFFVNNPNYLKFKTEKSIDDEFLTGWFEYRSENILNLTMLIDNSLELLSIGIDDYNLLSLRNLYAELDLYSLFVYDGFSTTAMISFEKFRQLSIEEKMNLLFNDKMNDGMILIRNLFEKFFEKITEYSRHHQQTQTMNISRKELLRKFLINLVHKDFEQCLKIFETYTIVNRTPDQLKQLKILDDPCDLIELALDCIRSYSKPDDLDLAFKIMECLPERDQASLLNKQLNHGKNQDQQNEWLERFNRMNDEADDMAYHLSMVEFLCENSTRISVKELIRIANEDKADQQQLKFIEKIVNNFCKQRCSTSNNNISDHTTISNEWKQFFVNLKDLTKKYFPLINDEQLLEQTVRCLLWSNNEYFIQLAFKHIDHVELRNNSNSSAKKLNIEKGRSILRLVIQDYIRYAGPQPEDEMLKYAKMCLDFLQTLDPNDSDTINHLNFLEAIQLLNKEFPNKLWLPIRIHNISRQQELLDAILSSSNDAHKKIDEILKIISLLNLFKSSDDNSNDNDDNTDDDDEQEARLLNKIGEKAIENLDYKTANDLAINIMDRNLQSGWPLCYQICCLIMKRNDEDSEFGSSITIDQQLRLLSFVLANCPDNNIQIHYDLLNQLKHLKQLHLNHLVEPKIYINFHGQPTTTTIKMK